MDHKLTQTGHVLLLSSVLAVSVLPPAPIQFDAQSGEVVQQLQVEALSKAVHKAVFRVQTETHGPQYLCVFLAQVVKGIHQLLQIRVSIHHISCQDVVETMCGTRETLLHLLTPDQLCDLGGDQEVRITMFKQTYLTFKVK